MLAPSAVMERRVRLQQTRANGPLIAARLRHAYGYSVLVCARTVDDMCATIQSNTINTQPEELDMCALRCFGTGKWRLFRNTPQVQLVNRP